MINGFINLNKPNTVSSNKALGILKHALRTLGIKEKVGHFGTLDPLAEGVLPVALGRATRLFDYSLDKVKVYEAEFLLGADSPSLDKGTDIEYYPFEMPGEDIIESALNSLTGEVMQIPPAFSAKSVDGVRAYKLARSGEDVVLQPKKVTIYSIRLISSDRENKIVKVGIECGGGTYVRSIARDFGALLGTKCIMISLVRTQSGFFRIENALSLAEAEKNPESILANIVNLSDYLSSFSKTTVTEEEKRTLLNGITIDRDLSGLTAVFCGETPIGIGENVETGKMKIKTWLL